MDISQNNYAVPATSNYPGSATAAVVTFAAIATRMHSFKQIVWSYDGTPVGGRLSITIGATTVFDISITAGGPGFIPLDFKAPKNQAVTVTLASGGVGITGKLNIIGKDA